MPPRMQSQRQRTEGNEPSDAGSDRASSPMPGDRGRGRGRTRGRGRGRGRGRTARRVAEPAPEGGMAEVIAGMRGLQQAVETLVGVVGLQPRAEAGPHAQRQAPPFPGVEVSTQEFLNLKPPTFSGNLVTEDPQLFIDKMVKTVRASRCSTTRAVELAAYQLEGVAEQWYENLLRERPVGSSPMTWEECTEAFMTRFLPASTRARLATEFERLT